MTAASTSPSRTSSRASSAVAASVTSKASGSVRAEAVSEVTAIGVRLSLCAVKPAQRTAASTITLPLAWLAL